MSRHAQPNISVFSRDLMAPAIGQAVVKLDPRQLWSATR